MKYIIIHHTGGTDKNPKADTSHHTFEVVNQYHKNKWGFESSIGKFIGYHYFIDKKGEVTQGRLDGEMGAHTKGHNNNLGICLAGNFDVSEPTDAQTQALKELLQKKIQKYNIQPENIVPHRHFANKSCYGKNLKNDWARKLVKPQISCAIVRNQCSAITMKKINDAEKWFLPYCNMNIDVHTINEKPKWNNGEIDLDWWKWNISPIVQGYDIAAHCLPSRLWENEEYGGWHKLQDVFGTRRIDLHADSGDKSRDFADIQEEFYGRLLHELCHTLDQLFGGVDNVHKFDYKKKDLKAVLDTINFSAEKKGYELDSQFRMFKKYDGRIIERKISKRKQNDSDFLEFANSQGFYKTIK